jgi:hypothetical protein
MSSFQQRLARRVERALIARWIERARLAEAIVWLAGVEAEALEKCWELLRCLIDGK